MTNGGSHSRADTYIQQPPDDANASPSNAAMVRKRGRKPSAAERGQKRAFELSEEQDEDTRHQDHTSDVSIPAPSSLTGPHDEDVMQIQTEDARVRAQELATVRRALEEQDSRLDDELRLPAKGKRGRPRKQPQNEWQNGTEDGLFPDLNSQSRASIQSQNKQVDVFREPGADIVDGPPKKERRGEAASVKGSSSRKPKPAERNPRAKVTSKRGRETRAGAVASMQKTPDAEAQGGVECDLEVAEPVQEATTSLSQPAQDLPKARGRPKPRSLVLLRSETPQDAANFTRSGRTSVKPLAFWRNEKFVFSNTKEDGQRLSLAGIKEVIRTREAEEGLPRHKRKKNTKKRASDVTSGDPGRPEKWEKAGSLEGQVMVWDPHLGKASDESLENIGKNARYTFTAIDLLMIHRACRGSEGVRGALQRSQKSKFQVRQNHSSPLLTFWDRRTSSGRGEKNQEFEAESHGILGILRSRASHNQCVPIQYWPWGNVASA